MADITGFYEVDGLVKQKEQLERLLTSNPEMEKKIQGLVRQVLAAARKNISNAAREAMKSDPRRAYTAVKSAIYKRILGGNVSLLDKRGVKRTAEPPIVHQLESRVNSKGNHRGGNRMPRSQRTKDLLTYAGSSRGFILRFLNNGAGPRDSKIGFRGSIAPRNFFSSSSHQAMSQAADHLDYLIEKLIKQEIG